jgi:hypothetical protein
VMEKVTISGGKFIEAGATFSPGKKDTRLNLSSPGPYRKKIDSARQMNVILYDTEDKRAWLVDGANALIHLTRAQLGLELYSKGSFDLDSFPHTDPELGSDAAVEALKSIGDKNPVLFEDSPSFGQSTSTVIKWGVKDLVLENWHILEQIQDHQTELSAPGMPIRLSPRDRLEGFGFMDIINGGRSIRPRVAGLKMTGRGWVDFTREIAAITLMARGFGEMIKPSPGSNKLCATWATVPKGKDYLVVRIHHLREICEQFGELRSSPLQVVQGLYWHPTTSLFGDCKIKSRHRTTECLIHNDCVQEFHSRCFPRIGTLKPPFEGDLAGAVIFGFSVTTSGLAVAVRKWWPRNPKLEAMDNEAACIAEDAKDSTLAVSISDPESSIFQDSGLGGSKSGSDEPETSSNSRLLPSQVSASSRNSKHENRSQNCVESSSPSQHSEVDKRAGKDYENYQDLREAYNSISLVSSSPHDQENITRRTSNTQEKCIRGNDEPLIKLRPSGQWQALRVPGSRSNENQSRSTSSDKQRVRPVGSDESSSYHGEKTFSLHAAPAGSQRLSTRQIDPNPSIKGKEPNKDRECSDTYQYPQNTISSKERETNFTVQRHNNNLPSSKRAQSPKLDSQATDISTFSSSAMEDEDSESYGWEPGPAVQVPSRTRKSIRRIRGAKDLQLENKRRES